jgi:hypothetical protein
MPEVTDECQRIDDAAAGVDHGLDHGDGSVSRLMVDNDYTYLPILGDGHELAGVLSLRQLLEHKIDHLANELDAVTQYLAVDGPGGD